MRIFKLCGKVMWATRLTILIYIVIFMALSVIMSFTASKEPSYQTYSTEKTEVAFIAEESTPLTEGLRTALSANANFVDVKDTPASLADALYYREVSYIIRVPAGFTDAFLKGENPRISCTSVPGSASGAYIGEKLRLWLNTASLYVKTGAVTDAGELAERMNSAARETASITISDGAKSVSDYSFLAYYFKYLAYIVTAVLISIIAVLMQVFNNKDLRRRTFCSPITARQYNTQFILAGMAFSAGFWLIMMICGALFDMKGFFRATTLLLALNSLVYTLMAAALGFMIGTLATSREQVGALSNMFALGFSFIGGIFVPLEFLGNGVLTVARFTPSYWYVKANDVISSAKDIGSVDITTARNDMLVILCFGAAFLTIGLAAEKRRREYSAS